MQQYYLGVNFLQSLRRLFYIVALKFMVTGFLDSGVPEFIETEQKMKFSIKDVFSKCVQIRSFLRIWPH